MYTSKSMVREEKVRALNTVVSIALAANVFSIAYTIGASEYGTVILLSPIIVMSFVLPPAVLGVASLLALKTDHVRTGAALAAVTALAVVFNLLQAPIHVLSMITYFFGL